MYNFKKANKIVSQFMNCEDDYRSIDKLIPVWKQISGVLDQMEGFIFETSFDKDDVYDVYLISNWTAKGLGGYPNSMQYECSKMDDELEISVQERALITTAKIISYEINKDFKIDLSSNKKEYTGKTKDFIEEYNYIDFSTFKSLARENENDLIEIIKENQLLNYQMEMALECLGTYGSMSDRVYNILIKYTKNDNSRVRRGSYYGLQNFNKKVDILEIFKNLHLKEISYYNKNELERIIKRLSN